MTTEAYAGPLDHGRTAFLGELIHTGHAVIIKKGGGALLWAFQPVAEFQLSHCLPLQPYNFGQVT